MSAGLAAASMAAAMMTAAPAEAWSAGSNTSNYAPALVGCQDPLNSSVYYEWLAFTGTDGQLNLLDYRAQGDNSSNADSIIAQYRLGDHAVGAPTLACTETNRLVMAWRNSANQIVLAYAVASGGSIVLSSPVTWSETSDATPSITGSHDANIPNTVIGWAGTDSSHHINMAFVNSNLTEGAKYKTTDYTRSGASLGVGQLVINGPFGPGWYVTFLAASGTPYIFVGYFPPGGTTTLGSVRTTDYSAFTATISLTGLMWKGYTNNLIYQGTFNGTSNLGGSAPFTDTTLSSPADDDYCATAYLGTNNHIYYDTEPFFGCTAG
jgi:hypothetical protein